MEVALSYSNEQGTNIDVGLACSSAWAWLESNGIIAKHPEQDNEWFLPTKRATEVNNHQALRQVISNQQLPEEFLHPELLVNARPLFL